jgi:predicted 2-oxoglutarate/Fe(II)-dependent dioxygenase YbiX
MSKDDVLVQPDAIAAEDLMQVIEYVRAAQTSDSLVSSFQDSTESGETQWVIDRKVRDTQEVQLHAAIEEKLSRIHRMNIDAFINPFYAVDVRDCEPLQVLHYGVGGHYIPHVDAETLYKDDAGLSMWEKTLDRDLSIVYFLNDDFEGGELIFPSLELVIKPRAGTLVCFPSDHNFIHGVNPVSQGHRYTLVTWMRIEGMPTPDEINELALEEYNRVWPKQVEQRSRVAKGGIRTLDADRFG